MNSETYRIERLRPEHTLTRFDCGDEDYNSWLTLHAREADTRATAAVSVLVRNSGDSGDSAPTVCGYFAICPTTVQRAGAPRQIERSIMRQAPGWLLAKLAIDSSLRGGTWSRELLRAALEEILRAADRGGGQVIVVDAGNERLVEWYRAQGFLGTGGDDLRLYLKVATARKYLAS